MDEYRPNRLIDLPNKALPSDSSYRQDLIYTKMKNLVKGQVINIILLIMT